MSSLPVAEAVDNPPPFTPKLGGWHRAPWHKFGDVSEWPPEFKALSTKLDRRRALGEWSLAFAHLKAGTRRNLALCRAEQYNDFASLLEGLVGGGVEDSSQVSGYEKLTEDTRSLCLSTLREKLASVEAHHVPRILDVTFRRLPVAQKQRRAAVSDSSGLVSFEETDGSKQTQSELMDPPTPAETLAATKVLRGLWVLAPQSCAAAANAGAAETLTLALEQGGFSPHPPDGTPSGKIQSALTQWRVEHGNGSREGSLKRNGVARHASSFTSENPFDTTSDNPPLKIAFPEGKGVNGEVPAVVSIGWDVRDPEKTFAQPSLDAVRCEILEALLSLMANDFASRKVFLNRRGVQTVAGYLVPWLAEGGEDAPGELVQRSIVFLGVLIKHVLPSQDQDNSGLTQEGENLARLATETLAATIGAETTLEILEAAEDLQDEQNFADGEGDYFSGDEGEGGNTGGGGLGSLRGSPRNATGSSADRTPGTALLQNATRAGGLPAPPEGAVEAMRDEMNATDAGY